MSVFDVIAEQQAKIKRKQGESDLQLARRLYFVQMEVYSSYAGRDIWRDFEDLPKVDREVWIKKAEEWK